MVSEGRAEVDGHFTTVNCALDVEKATIDDGGGRLGLVGTNRGVIHLLQVDIRRAYRGVGHIATGGIERHTADGCAHHLRQFPGRDDELAPGEVVEIEDIGGDCVFGGRTVIHGEGFHAVHVGEVAPARGRLIVCQ